MPVVRKLGTKEKGEDIILALRSAVPAFPRCPRGESRALFLLALPGLRPAPARPEGLAFVRLSPAHKSKSHALFFFKDA